MDPVRQQYEALPYPERDPADEAKRLIAGSPSDPVEIDHFLFRGRRDWRAPFRVLVAGGGTGDALVMLAQRLALMRCPAEITYLDLSTASRAVAEARIATRGLSESVRFLTGDLLQAPELGPFDYIDCCGVLHHLPEPDAGFAALAGALAEGGGMGLMVYAPHGRAGVYPLQRAFGTLFADEAPGEKVRLARIALGGLPESHWFRRNPFLGDHEQSDAGLHDLLMHSRDRPYTVSALFAALDRAGLAPRGFVPEAAYDPAQYLPDDLKPRLKALDAAQRAQLAEDLAANMKTHVIYAAHRDAGEGRAKPALDQVPHLSGVRAQDLARAVGAQGGLKVESGGLPLIAKIPKEAAPFLGRIDGRTPLGEIAKGRDWMSFSMLWGPASRALEGFNILHYSRGGRR